MDMVTSCLLRMPRNLVKQELCLGTEVGRGPRRCEIQSLRNLLSVFPTLDLPRWLAKAWEGGIVSVSFDSVELKFKPLEEPSRTVSSCLH